MSESNPSQFYDLAEYYDPLNDWKDYRKEAEVLERIALRSGKTRNASWLDVACGTGRHLEFLRRAHSVVGIDLSPRMLRIARRRLPGVRLIQGDMRSFRLHRRFDVISCLFSAIGHLRTKAEVQRTFANFARHLAPGGIVIVEPWIDPSKFRSGFLHLRTSEGASQTFVRLATSERRGHHSVIRFHFLIGTPRRGIRHAEVIDVGLLVSPKELVRLMEAAGLKSRFLSHGLTPGRGLLIGVKRREVRTNGSPRPRLA